MDKFVIYKDTGGMCHNLGGLSKINIGSKPIKL